MTAKDEELMDAVSRADPARADMPPAKGSTRYNSILEASMRTDRTEDKRAAVVRNRPTTHPRWGRRLGIKCRGGTDPGYRRHCGRASARARGECPCHSAHCGDQYGED